MSKEILTFTKYQQGIFVDFHIDAFGQTCTFLNLSFVVHNIIHYIYPRSKLITL